ncbi:MAG: TipAS antibiotic-recognition domain-containing protein [Verrucomicrobia bacterium]|nr:TipAS antibiotic-recognition domain-containing protein [Verrucomicrobiota bacterium]
MKDQEMYKGFLTQEQQEEYQKYLKNRLGANDPTFAECEKNVKGWTKVEWEKLTKEFESICKEISQAMEKGLEVDVPEVQEIIPRHHKWLKKFWTPNQESYTGLGRIYMGFE